MGYMIKDDIPYAGSPSNFTLNEASAYNPSTEYVVGDYCIYQNVLRKCTGATTGAFDASKWTQTKIDAEIGSLSESIGDLLKISDITVDFTMPAGNYYVIVDKNVAMQGYKLIAVSMTEQQHIAYDVIYSVRNDSTVRVIGVTANRTSPTTATNSSAKFRCVYMKQ